MWTNFLRFARAAVRILFILETQVFAYLPHYGWALLLSPIALVNPALYQSIEGKLYKVASFLGSVAGWTAGYTYYEVGDDVSSCFEDECLIIANHLSFVDGQTFMSVLQHKSDILERNIAFIDPVTRFTHYGITAWIHGDVFVKKGSIEKEKDRIKKYLTFAFSRRNFKSIILFPEGAFLNNNKPSSDRYAREKNVPKLEYVCLPRTGVFLAIINALHPKNVLDTESDKGFAISKFNNVRPLKWIVDVTFIHQKGEPLSWFSMILMIEKPSKIFLHYRLFPIETVPNDKESALAWLNERFMEKEHMRKEFFKAEPFPSGQSRKCKLFKYPKQVNFSITWLLIVNVFSIISTLLHYKLISWILFLFVVVR